MCYNEDKELPYFVYIQILDSNPEMYVSEQSQCCLGNKKLTICARNVTIPAFCTAHSHQCYPLHAQISLTSMFTLNETLEYTVNSEDPNT